MVSLCTLHLPGVEASPCRLVPVGLLRGARRLELQCYPCRVRAYLPALGMVLSSPLFSRHPSIWKHRFLLTIRNLDAQGPFRIIYIPPLRASGFLLLVTGLILRLAFLGPLRS